MSNSLKNAILRNPAGRIFLVERDPGWPSPATLRRLDREPREQARIYRPSNEIQDWENLVPRSEASRELNDLKAACRAMLQDVGAWPKPNPRTDYLVHGDALYWNRIAQLVEA
jgi:hypothetical protein